MWHFRTWYSGGFGSVRLVIGLNDLMGLSEPKQFYDSMLDKPVLSVKTITLCLYHGATEC